MNFLNDLNTAQKNSVEYINGPLMVIAGAGSGKTRVLTYKIAYLIQKGWEPYNILALTFTNKAANEMKERIAHLVNPTDAQYVWAGTFHSIFAKILRREAEKINYTSNFTIYDTDDSKKIITDILKKMKLHENENYKPNLILSKISRLKNNLISPTKYEMNPSFTYEDRVQNREYFIEIYKTYQKQLSKNHAMDFDDLLYYTNVLFQDFPQELSKYQNLFQYILVDEFQDTNFAQYLSVFQLAKSHQNICVVGDDAQSIYSFRGANIDNIIRNFQKDFPNYKLFKLEENYRSTKHIVEASNFVIKKNKNQIAKQIYTNNPEGEPITIFPCIDENHEAQLIAKEILSLTQHENISFSNICILYRTNAQSRVFEDIFRTYRIPYKIWGGLSFYQRKEIKDLLAYFRTVINPNDQEALLRIINFPPRGIGDTTIEKILNYAYDNQVSIFEILKNCRLIQDNLNISDRQMNTIENFVAHIETFRAISQNTPAHILAQKIIEFSGIINFYETQTNQENREKILNIKELLNAVYQFTKTQTVTFNQSTDELQNSLEQRTLQDFLQQVSLLTSQDIENNNDISPKVSLMTIHLSKGLEFPYVFIVGMEENLFPSSLSISKSDIEEERRLFYVAVTRAKKKVNISFAQRRFINGRTNSSQPSRFINELPQDSLNIKESNSYYQHKNNDYRDTKSTKIQQNNKAHYPKKLIPLSHIKSQNIISENKNLQKGDKIYHEKFEVGTVLEISGTWPNSKAIIQFEKYGQKLLLLNFAVLKKI